MPTCNRLSSSVILETWSTQGWGDLCCWQHPTITYEAFLTGITESYNNACLRNRVFSDYETQLFTDCLSGDSSSNTNTTDSYWSASTGGISNSGLTGNVGIGTTTPNEKLTVVGAISATTDLYIDDNMYSGTTNLLDIFASSDITNQDVYWSANTDGSISTSGLTTNIGLGITAPKTKLDVHHNPTNLLNDTGGGEVVYFGTNSGVMNEFCFAGKLMYLHTDGIWYPADADAVTKGGSQLLGICLAGTVAAGGMLIRGFFDARTYVQGAFAKGMPCYVSEDTGKIDFTAPSGPGEYVRVVGYGTDTANVIYFDPDKTWVELS